MASQVNRDFFKKAKKVDRAIELRDNEAVIPAVKERAEVRAKLPNRRLLTIEERSEIVQERMASLKSLEEEIEVERKVLLETVKSFELTKSGASEVVSQNLKIKSLMERRSKLSRPESWIEVLSGLTLKDVFASKRDDRKIGADLFQVKRRVEPILSLYIDLDLAAAATTTDAATATATAADAAPATATATAKPGTLASIAEAAAPLTAAQGVIIGQKRVIKTKKLAATAPAGPVSFTM
jgi:hypothetical protein